MGVGDRRVGRSVRGRAAIVGVSRRGGSMIVRRVCIVGGHGVVSRLAMMAVVFLDMRMIAVFVMRLDIRRIRDVRDVIVRVMGMHMGVSADPRRDGRLRAPGEGWRQV